MRLTALIVLWGMLLNAQNLGNLTFGTDTTLDLITWNIERFPKNGQTSVNYAANIIEALDADLVAVQEIDSKSHFEQLVDKLDGWEGLYVDAEYLGLAYIYKTDVIEVLDTFQIYTNLNREFPRPPFVMEMKYEGEIYYVINNHFKCCGDGDLESGDAWDEETRRFHASNLLEAYVNTNHPTENVIVLGDLNDIITDPASDNVFKAFTDAPDRYAFVDMEIAKGPSSGWSFPNWPSQIDHILISDELFAALDRDASEVQTIKVDEYLDGGFDEYDENITDHRPVGLKIDVASDVSAVGELHKYNANISVYPNPFQGSATIVFEYLERSAQIDIYNAVGRLVDSYTIQSGEAQMIWDATGFPSGVYYIALKTESEHRSITKAIHAD